MPFCCFSRFTDLSHSRALYAKAKKLCDKTQYTKALQILNQVRTLKIQSVVSEAWKLFLVCSHELRLTNEQIVQELIEYQKLDNQNSKLMLQIGTFLIGSLRDQEAEGWLRKSAQQFPKDFENYHQITEVLKKHRQFNLLVQFAEKWEENSGNSSEQLVKIGKQYDSIKECERAAAIFLKIAKRYPKQKQYLLLYLSNQRLKYTPNPKKAFEMIQNARVYFGLDYGLLQMQALFYKIIGDTDVFVDIIRHCISENGSVSREIYYLFIGSLIDQYQIHQANKYAIMLAQTHKQYIFSLWQVARTEFLLANFQSYESICKTILKRYELEGYSKPDNILAVFQVYNMKNDLQRAAQMLELYYQIATQSFQRNPQAIGHAVAFYQLHKDIEKQQYYLKLRLRKSQDIVLAQFKLAEIYNKKDNRQECLKILQIYSEKSSFLSIFQKANYLGLLMKLGLIKESLEFYQLNLINICEQQQQFRTHMDCLIISIKCLIQNDKIEDAFQLFIKCEQICRIHFQTHIILRQIQVFLKLLDFCLFFGRLGVFEYYSQTISDLFNRVNGRFMKNHQSQLIKLMETYKKQSLQWLLHLMRTKRAENKQSIIKQILNSYQNLSQGFMIDIFLIIREQNYVKTKGQNLQNLYSNT